MFRSKTVLILGAGASAEVGLPVGSKLLDDICKLLDIRYELGNRMISGDHQISKALKFILDERGGVAIYNAHLGAGRQIANSAMQAISIDNIVDGLEDENIERMSKLGIVRAIQAAERSSKYFRSKEEHSAELRLNEFSGTWYRSLTQLLTEGVRKSEVERVFENLSVISFNYDRCIEAYLPRSISEYYGIEPGPVVDRFTEVPIYRPYGIAGELTWDRRTGFPRGFGGIDYKYLTDSSRLIRTFTQGVEDPASLVDMHAALKEAEQIIFLGFAFHRQNMELLECDVGRGTRVLATASGISESDREIVKEEMRASFRLPPIDRYQDVSIELVPVQCAELFQSHWRTITS